MDYGKVDADSFGRSLRGLGLNLLVRDVFVEVAFLEAVFEMSAYQPTADFAIMTYGDQVFQLHSDGTYGAHPLLGMLPENPPRGAGGLTEPIGSGAVLACPCRVVIYRENAASTSKLSPIAGSSIGEAGLGVFGVWSASASFFAHGKSAENPR